MEESYGHIVPVAAPREKKGPPTALSVGISILSLIPYIIIMVAVGFQFKMAFFHYSRLSTTSHETVPPREPTHPPAYTMTCGRYIDYNSSVLPWITYLSNPHIQNVKCIGTIIGTHWVITSKECMASPHPLTSSVQVTLSGDSTSNRIEVKNSKIIHEKLLLIGFPSPLKVGDKIAEPVCLAPLNIIFEGSKAYVFGTEGDETFKTEVSPVNTFACSSDNVIISQRNQMCSKPIRDCQHMHGMPLMMEGSDSRYYLIGIQVPTHPCNSTSYISVSKYTTAILDMILANGGLPESQSGETYVEDVEEPQPRTEA